MNGYHGYSKALFLWLALLYSFALQGQELEWDRTFGGNDREGFEYIHVTNDGGYILGGTSWSGISGDKSEPHYGTSGDYERGGDYWVVKVDAEGTKEWDRTIGGDKDDRLVAVQQTTDGGYILGGTSWSDISGDKTENTNGENDYWLVKLDADGNKVWDLTIGGDGRDFLSFLQQTRDGGYILGGTSDSGISGDKTEDNLGIDYWVVKLDAAGNKEWDQTMGGDSYDGLQTLQQTFDGGYILGGSSFSNKSGDKSEDNRGECGPEDYDCSTDYWVVKLDASGRKEWDRTIGGASFDELLSLQQTSDGGYILGGYSNSNASGDKTEDNIALCDSDDEEICPPDYWVVKLDATGNKEWDNTVGGDKGDRLAAVRQTSDGGYILGGSSSSRISGDKTEDNIGICDPEDGVCPADYWIVKLDATGKKEWDRVFGGSHYDALQSLQLSPDGGYILGGESSSGISGDKSEASRGFTDYWIIKLSGDEQCTPPAPVITVEPTSNVYTGGDANTIYLGYGPQSVRLVASGAERYEWSPGTGLSDATVANPVFTPSTAGTYTFTVRGYNGTCSATATVTINVVDVRCGKGKVLVCHKGKLICISTSAVAAHLRNHKDDSLGDCASQFAPEKVLTINLSLKVFPNPFRDWANVEFFLPQQGKFRIELYSSNGKMLGVIAEGQAQAGQLISREVRADKLREGVYYLKLITNEEVRTVRLVLKN